jgi:hypothetical protein
LTEENRVSLLRRRQPVIVDVSGTLRVGSTSEGVVALGANGRCADERIGRNILRAASRRPDGVIFLLAWLSRPGFQPAEEYDRLNRGRTTRTAPLPVRPVDRPHRLRGRHPGDGLNPQQHASISHRLKAWPTPFSAVVDSGDTAVRATGSVEAPRQSGACAWASLQRWNLHGCGSVTQAFRRRRSVTRASFRRRARCVHDP